MKDMSNSSASSSLNQVDGGVIHVTDRSHKYNAGWYRDEFAPVRFIRAGFYITRRQSDKCKVVQRYAPLSEYFRRGAFILLMVMSDKSGWYRAGAPLHGYFPWRRFLFSNQEVKMNFSKAMKAAVIIFTGAIAAAGLTACGGIKTAADSPSKSGVKIGFIAALTGGAAAYGKSQEEGIRMAVEEINQKGEIPIELFVEDSKGSPSDAMNVTKRLIQKKAAVIIGPMTSNEAKAAGPIMQNAKIPSLEISVTAEGITEIGDYIFRNSVPESMNIPQTAKKTHRLLGYETAAILYAHDNEQHVTAQKYFRKTLEEEGVKIVDVETFGSKDSEYSAQLTNIENAKPDVVIVCSYYQEGARILKKMREMGMNQPVLGDNGFVSPELGKMAGAAADNVYVSSMWSAARDTAATKTFVENYTKKYGHAPDQFAAAAYDGVYMAMDAVQRAGSVTDTRKIRDAMAEMKGFNGVCGTFSFDAKRDPVVDLVLLKMEDGVFLAAGKQSS